MIVDFFKDGMEVHQLVNLAVTEKALDKFSADCNVLPSHELSIITGDKYCCLATSLGETAGSNNFGKGITNLKLQSYSLDKETYFEHE